MFVLEKTTFKHYVHSDIKKDKFDQSKLTHC